ncbi:MAG: histidine phosphatase family protein [Myxococcota bacterium]
MTNHFTLHLVRHGQSKWNALGRIQGQTNSELDEIGLHQADCAGRALKKRPLTALYASDLVRAQQTAKAIARYVDLDVRTDARLRETNFGILEGLTWAEAEANHPEVYKHMREHDFLLPEGESRLQTLERAREIFEELAAQHGPCEVAAVSHGGLIAFFLKDVVGIPLSYRARFKTANASISTFQRTPEGWRLITWGAVDHLTEK